MEQRQKDVDKLFTYFFGTMIISDHEYMFNAVDGYLNFPGIPNHWLKVDSYIKHCIENNMKKELDHVILILKLLLFVRYAA